MKYKGIRKLYYSISEISEMLGVKQSVIRYWESEFKELKPQKNRAGNRIYKKDDIAILRLIHHYVYERHLSIHEANEVITDLKNDGLYKRKLQEVNSKEIIPVPMDHDESDEIDIVDDTDDLEEVDEDEAIDEDQEDIEVTGSDEDDETEEAPHFEIVTPTQETFIYPLDDQNSVSDEADTDEEDIAKPVVEPEPEIIPEPEPTRIPEPKKVIEPEPVIKQHDPELKELLRKISGNIRDIIDILNE